MRRLAGPGVALILLVWGAFIPLGFFIPHDMLFQILNSMIVSAGLGCFIMFWEGLWALLKWRPSAWTGADIWVIGTELLMLGLSVTFATAWIYRARGMPISIGHPIEAFARWLIVTGMLATLVASASTTKGIPSRAYVRAGIFATIGVGAALVLASLGVN